MPEPSMPSCLNRRPAVSMIRCRVASLCSLRYLATRTSSSKRTRPAQGPAPLYGDRHTNDPSSLQIPPGRMRGDSSHALGSSQMLLPSMVAHAPTRPSGSSPWWRPQGGAGKRDRHRAQSAAVVELDGLVGDVDKHVERAALEVVEVVGLQRPLVRTPPAEVPECSNRG